MNTLRLEELEKRDLLSGGYLMPPMRDSRSFGDVRQPASGMERPAFDDFGGGPGRPDMGGPITGSARMMTPADVNTNVVVVEVVEVVIVVNSPDHGTTVTDGGSDSAGSGTISASVPKSPVKALDSYTPAADPTPVHAAVAAVPTHTNPTTTPFVLVPATNVVAAETQGVVAAQIPLRAVNFGDSFAGRAGGAGPLVLPGGQGADDPRSPGETITESVEPPTALAAPMVISTLDAVDLTSLGRGLGRFIDRLERAGEELVGDGDGLRPWLIAGAAAATAAEIARRQLKRAAELAAEADAHPNQIFVG